MCKYKKLQIWIHTNKQYLSERFIVRLFYSVDSGLANMLYKAIANALIIRYGYCNIHSCQFNAKLVV